MKIKTEDIEPEEAPQETSGWDDSDRENSEQEGNEQASDRGDDESEEEEERMQFSEITEHETRKIFATSKKEKYNIERQELPKRLEQAIRESFARLVVTRGAPLGSGIRLQTCVHRYGARSLHLRHQCRGS